MKKIILLTVAVCSTILASAQYEIDTSKSLVRWTGSNLFKFNEHYGTVKFKNGVILMDKDSIVGGSFDVDMNSIINADGKYNEMLVGHLKNEDFFDVEKYPIAKLEITNVKYTNSVSLSISAELTIKNITEPIEYKSTFENHQNKIVMKSKFIIDRTRWKINYESKSLFDSLKDDIISDAIEFEVIITTK